MAILVTGGAGYIGAHTCLALLNAGEDVVVADNLYNADGAALDAVRAVAGRGVRLCATDICDADGVGRLFSENGIDGVIHLAAYKSASESVARPLRYYQNNLVGAITLLSAMREHGVRAVVFGSSAAVYGEAESEFIDEEAPTRPVSAYGESKLMSERIMGSEARSDAGFSAVALRYFNVIGADESGRLGDSPLMETGSLLSRVVAVATGKTAALPVYGTDCATHDGTCARDYVHVTDVARANVAALRFAREHTGMEIFNLGNASRGGVTVLDVVRAFERVNHVKIPTVPRPRRPGDAERCVCDAGKAARLLGWTPELPLEEMCRSAYRFAISTFS
jgi:UDP-glucose 4-epimerase